MSRCDSLLSLLRAMISVDTASGEPDAESPLCDMLESISQSFGISTRRLPVVGRCDNLLLEVRAHPEAPWLLFVSHMDTVSAEGMTISPFAAELSDGRVYGRGACDTKGSGAAMLWALKHYAEQPGTANIALLFSVNEEAGMDGIASFASMPKELLGFNVSAAVVGEPTELAVGIAHNGSCRGTLWAKGVAAHSSNPALGHSAITAMMRLGVFLEENYIPTLQQRHSDTGKAEASINTITGGTRANIIPDYCEAQLDRRVLPSEDVQCVSQEITEAVAAFSKLYPNYEIGVHLRNESLQFEVSRDAYIVQLAVACGQRLGVGTPQGLSFGTEAGHLSQAGIPAIVLGPGSLLQAHTKDEWLDIRQLEMAEVFYRSLMYDFPA